MGSAAAAYRMNTPHVPLLREIDGSLYYHLASEEDDELSSTMMSTIENMCNRNIAADVAIDRIYDQCGGVGTPFDPPTKYSPVAYFVY